MTISHDDQRFWDIRTLDRRVKKGLISRKDVDKHIKALADSKDRIAPPSDDHEVDG